MGSYLAQYAEFADNFSIAGKGNSYASLDARAGAKLYPGVALAALTDASLNTEIVTASVLSELIGSWNRGESIVVTSNPSPPLTLYSLQPKLHAD